MKAISIHDPGKNAQLVLEEVPDPLMGSSDVLIRVAYSSVNRADLLQARGLYPPPKGASPILGLECAGKVEQIGQDASQIAPGIKPGMPVMALLTGGGYAQKVVADIRCVLPAPSILTGPQAGSFTETYLTAYLNIFLLGGITKGNTVLIHGGSGGVGTAAINLCESAGVTTIVTAGSSERCNNCLHRGASKAINYSTENFANEVNEFTNGDGVDLILDCIGAPYLEPNLNCLKSDGRLVIIGLMGGTQTQLNMAKLLMKRVNIIGSTLRSLSTQRKAHIIQSFQNQFGSELASGKLIPLVHKIVDLENAQDAHEILKQSAHFGKVALQIEA